MVFYKVPAIRHDDQNDHHNDHDEDYLNISDRNKKETAKSYHLHHLRRIAMMGLYFTNLDISDCCLWFDFFFTKLDCSD